MRVVRELRGRSVEFGGEEHRGWLPPMAATPLDTSIEIVSLDFEIRETDGGYLLIWLGAESRHSGDTWHESVDDALQQAKLWFHVEPKEWSTL